MSGQLNLYGEFVDITSSEGVKLLNNAIHNFKSPSIGTLQLCSDDAAKFIWAIRDLGSQY